MIYDLNFLLEIDEKHHKCQIEKDKNRQKYIEHITGLEFVRVQAYNMFDFEKDLRNKLNKKIWGHSN